MRYALALLAIVSIATPSMADDLPRGIVADQPAEGPFVKVDEGYMVPYAEKIVGTDIEIEMVPVPGGEFTFGSSADEEDRGDLELEAVRVSLPPYWVAKHELTWKAYWEYMQLNDVFAELEILKSKLASTDPAEAEAAKAAVAKLPALAKAVGAKVSDLDGITAPTPLYDPSTTYEFGEDPDMPATTMTPYAAKQFTKWLSRTTGAQYRLPTEAEWEFAARGGSESNEVESLDDVAWYDDTADWEPHVVGEKQANEYGLHDMIGNVAEWVIDEYDEDLERPDKPVLSWEEAIRWAETNDSRVCRGGLYDSVAEDCRVTSRFYSEELNWKANDPCAPLSPWWYTDYPANGVGIRLVRSYQPLSTELIQRFWEPESENMSTDVASRLAIRRGKLGPASKELPQVQAELKDPAVRTIIDGK
ncbi:formylglycine-generating enzyme family protein [Aeoliella mucimassa]|nr:SUMF1/EgtB/PvdO family nonheme iron enzyme [Aeoliella mucimassa]